VIILGPGSLYTSIIPNLLVSHITEAIVNSSAKKFYICNAMTQPGETSGFSVADHIKVLTDHSNPGVLEYCLANNAVIDPELLLKYKHEGSVPVVIDRERIKAMGYRLIEHDLVLVDGYVRHDAKKLANLILKHIN
jgi:uncharacterized cofD-like protein